MNVSFSIVMGNGFILPIHRALSTHAATAKGCTAIKDRMISFKGEFQVDRFDRFSHGSHGDLAILCGNAAHQLRIVIVAGQLHMAFDRTAGGSDRTTKESQDIHICLIQIDIYIERYRFIGLAAGEQISRKRALGAGFVVILCNQCILDRHHIVGYICHEREGIKGNISIARVSHADGNIGFRRFFIPGKRNGSRHQAGKLHVFLFQNLWNPGYVHILSRYLDIQFSIRSHGALSCQKSCAYRDMELADIERAIGIGEVDTPFSYHRLAQMTALEVGFEIDTGIIHGAADAHAAIHRAVHRLGGQVEETHHFFDIPTIKLEEPLQASRVGVVITPPGELAIQLIECPIIERNHMILVMNPCGGHVNRCAPQSNLTTGNGPIKNGIVCRAGHTALHIDLSIQAAAREHALHADIRQGHLHVDAVLFHRAVHDGGAVVNVAHAVSNGEPIAIIGVLSGNTLEEFAHDGSIPSMEVPFDDRIVGIAGDGYRISYPAGDGVRHVCQGKELFDSCFIRFDSKVHGIRPIDAHAAADLVIAFRALPVQIGNLKRTIGKRHISFYFIKDKSLHGALPRRDRAFAYRIIQGAGHMGLAGQGAGHIDARQGGKLRHVDARCFSSEIHGRAIVALYGPSPFPTGAGEVCNMRESILGRYFAGERVRHNALIGGRQAIEDTVPVTISI